MAYKIRYKPSKNLMTDVKGKAMVWNTKTSAERFVRTMFSERPESDYKIIKVKTR